ncbi:energy transducer TonB [Alterisphingorhabdus coralli]|uniref:TonB family protein n=1 Tax=Alterisphingorhabdus coralli TaxID=3071408 RepID=A0AA97I1Y1_9SPHN|nr:TonB family protein [Parasphingorhabdus sp. SCSIO 66989]WOE76577.1 TonB family protein [Parasphingorhabdus sp. SCSIO 66989]
MVYADQWTSALSPERPPVPRGWHWSLGALVSVMILGTGVWQYSRNAIPETGEMIDEMVVTLGAPARRLEPPPPGVETTDEPEIPTERAEDAPPPAAPEEPRAVAASSLDGSMASGTGAKPAPPKPLPPPPPEPPPKVTELPTDFVRISHAQYRNRIRYPTASRRIGEEGKGVLQVTIARSGKVLNAQLITSTGHRNLDREIERVAETVTQLDPLPANYANDTATTDISITFVLNR